jgi:predicted acylesterase/phospholipase RssA
MPENPKVSVVLGGGGAKGFVHLGVLQAVAAKPCDIVAIYGTSIGAIIAALFAYHFRFHHGKRPRLEAQQCAAESVSDLLLDTNFLRLADFNFSMFRRGFISGRRVRAWLETQLLAPGGTSAIRFSDLVRGDEHDIDLNITVTNATNGESVVASPSTSPGTFVSAAVRASMSIQGIFLDESIDYNGVAIKCWDGGVTGNCRFDLSQQKYPELLTVASSVTYRGEVTTLPDSILTGAIRPVLVLNRSADFWLRQIENLTQTLLGDRMKNVLLVHADLDGVSTLDFQINDERKRKLIDNGRDRAATLLAAHYGAR